MVLIIGLCPITFEFLGTSFVNTIFAPINEFCPITIGPNTLLPGVKKYNYPLLMA